MIKRILVIILTTTTIVMIIVMIIITIELPTFTWSSINIIIIVTCSSKPSLSACFQSPIRVRRAYANLHA